MTGETACPQRVRIVHLSDTHGLLPEYAVPPADILIHTGDFCLNRGSAREYAAFNRLLGAYPHQHRLVVLGNHDLFGRWETERMAALLPAATHVFDREEINVLGLRIFGVSYHQSLNGTELPKGLDLLVSHEPPLGILDRSRGGFRLGDKYLREQLDQAQPRYHLFGHVHEGYGAKTVTWRDTGQMTQCFNGSQADQRTTRLLRAARLIEVDVVAPLPGRDGVAPPRPLTPAATDPEPSPATTDGPGDSVPAAGTATTLSVT
eukprot:EG_transcript_22151